METLRQALEQARQRRVAVGHFNVSELVAFKAITDTASEPGVPVLVGVSEGERQFLGVHEVRGSSRRAGRCAGRLCSSMPITRTP